MSRTNTKQIVIRMTDANFERIKKKVAASGLTQQDFLLRAILNKPIINTEGLREFSTQLKGIGNNLNQLTRLVNAGFPISNSELAAIREELNKQWQLLKQFIPKQN
jgi:hypothetical protein